MAAVSLFDPHQRARRPMPGLAFVPLVGVLLFAAPALAAERSPLVFLGDKDYPPLSYLEDGVPRGFDVDVVKAIAGRLGRDIRVELLDWNVAQDRVLRGEADGLTDLGVSDSRRELFEFSDPTITHEYGLFVRAGTVAIHGVDDLNGRTVGVTEGGFPRRFLERRGSLRLAMIKNYEDGFARLLAGDIDAIGADIWVAAYTIERGRYQRLTMAGSPFASVSGVIAVKKGNSALLDEINRAIRSLKADGRVREIQERWRPKEMVFLSRERVQGVAAIVGGAFFVLILGALGFWVITLRKQIGVRRLVEAKLLQSTQRLEVALSAAEMGTWRWTAATQLTTRDANLNQILGVEAVESSHPFEDFLGRVHPEDRAAMKVEFDRAINERGSYFAEFRIVRPDGTCRWLRSRGKPFFSESGGLSYVTGTAIDVTDLRHVEERMRLMAQATQSANDCICIADTDGYLLYVNDAFLRTYEYDERELLGQHIGLLRSGDDPSDILERVAEASQREGWRGELWNRSKGGRVFSISLTTAPVRDKSGRIIAIVGVARDITREKLAEQALRASEEKFEKAFKASPDCIAITETGRGEVIEINDSFERMTGYSRQEILGRAGGTLGLFVDPAFRENILRQMREKGAVHDLEYQIRRKSGEIATILASAESIEIGGRPCFLSVNRDVTERKRFESHLRQAAEVNKLLVSELEAEALYIAIVESMHRIVNLDQATLLLYDPVSRDVRVQAQRGVLQPSLSLAGCRAVSEAAVRRPPLYTFHESELAGLGPAVAPLVHAGLKSMCCLPLSTRRGALGALVVGSKDPEGLAADELTVLQQLSTYVAIAIDNAHTYEEIKNLRDQLSNEKLYLEEEIRLDHNFTDIIGNSPAIKRVLQQIEVVAPTGASVLLLGETGTGKELLARAIHNRSPRKERTFVRLNLAALPTGLLESELFGYERGAFTGAQTSKIGRLALANRGTLFLDEVGDLPSEVQPKLLRVLQEREFEQLGSTKTQHVDVRLIAATNRALDQMVGEGSFRSDLYYRLNVFPVQVPPLRDRREDIPLLVRHFVQKFSTRLRRPMTSIPASTMSALQEWHWPGNIRELENVLERAVILSPGPTLHVPVREAKPSDEPAFAGAQEIQALPRAEPPRVAYQDGEREIILRTLRDTKGVVAGPEGAAARLGMKRTTLQSKMRKLGIKRPGF
jgi:formate hydrogenlyase transcriptional activator